MAQTSETTAPVHCYTNPSFCRQSEYIPDDDRENLPPPPQFQSNDELPPPPPPLQMHIQCGQSNPGFQGNTETSRIIDRQQQLQQQQLEIKQMEKRDKREHRRYCYLDDDDDDNNDNNTNRNNQTHKRYGSLPVDDRNIVQSYGLQSSRYEYIQDEQKGNHHHHRHPHHHHHHQLQRRPSNRYEFIPRQQQVQRQRSAPPVNQNDDTRRGELQQMRTNRNNGGRYAILPGEMDYSEDIPDHTVHCNNNNNININNNDDDDDDDDDDEDEDDNVRSNVGWNGNRISPVRHNSVNILQGRYSRVPLQDEELPPPALPERNLQQEYSTSPRNNLATRKLHEILTTPRKPRSRSEERTLSPKRQQSMNQTGTPQRRTLTPGGSPSSHTFSPTTRTTPQGTPQNRTFPTNGPQTSTPNKEPSARRCLPLIEKTTRQDVCPASNCGRLRYIGTAPVDLASMVHGEPPPRYGYLENGPESMPMVSGSPRYQVLPPDQKRNGYQSVESAFIARTAVVPPLSPPHSDVNTTLASALEKNDRRNAPLLLALVGVLTCGLAFYLSWTQGRKYYFDSAAGCGVCCALAGACRSLRRTWTGLGLAGLSALSCAGLLLLAAKSPRPGTPLHDITAGALCGVSVLGACLAILAVLTPKCNFGRHRRVHSWIPRLSP